MTGEARGKGSRKASERGESELKAEAKWRRLQLGSLPVVAAVLLSSCSDSPSILDTAGPSAARIERLWWVLFTISMVVFAVVLYFLFAALRRRNQPEMDVEEGDAIGRRMVLWGGFVGPTLVLLAVAVLVMIDIRALPAAGDEDDLTIEVVGWRWWWEVRYPDAGVETANEIHVPVGRPIRFVLLGGDVIHSFWVPQIGPKKDTIPGQVNELVLEFEEEGVFWGACLEFCGLQHAKMQLLVIAQPEEEYLEWLAAQAGPAAEPDTPSEERGREIFLSSTCVGCHVIRGVAEIADVGPDLTHLADRLTIGAVTLPATPEAVAAFVDHPDRFKPGLYMPEARLDGEALEDLVAYLMSLE